MGGVPVARQLAELARRELIVRRHDARIVGEVEYEFRHALVREAAYGMLTERDRRVGHGLAGEWLDRAGGADAMALAEHFEIGGAPARAADAYLRAAEEALRGGDLAAAVERADRGIGCGAAGDIAGRLRRVQAEAHMWRGEIPLALERGAEATEWLERGSAAWFAAIARVVVALYKLGRLDEMERWATAAADTVASDSGQDAKIGCLADAASALMLGGRYAAGAVLLETVQRTPANVESHDLELIAKVEEARACCAACAGDLGACAESLEAALRASEQAANRRNACSVRANLGSIYIELGDFEHAEAMLRAALDDAARRQLQDVKLSAQANLARVLVGRGELTDARALVEATVMASRHAALVRTELFARCYLAMIFMGIGDLKAAEREARAAVERSQSAPTIAVQAFAVLARALLGLGRVDEAVETAAEANSMLATFGALEEGESLIRLTFAEVLAASGRQDEAAAAIALARTALLARAEKLSDPTWRERFLRDVPDNARTLELARQWLGG